MDDQIRCPYCQKSFPVTEALKHQITEEVRSAFEREQKQAMWKKALAAAEERQKEQSGNELRTLKQAIEEKDKKLAEARDMEIEMRKERVRLEEEKKEIELKVVRRMDEERGRIVQESYRKALEENRLKHLEYEKKEQDLLKQIEELKRKAQQGSQQLQGEVPELVLQQTLEKECPYDEIREVPKGVVGADVIQVVKNDFGRVCGTIVWESKQAKAWSDGWLAKLRDDQRKIKADIAVIISQTLPSGVVHFSRLNGVWIGTPESVSGLATVLRQSLIDIAAIKMSAVGKQEKKEILWNYLQSIEFRQRLDAIKDAIDGARENLEKEKEFFRRKWARDEKYGQLISEHLLGMHGDLQAIIGKSLPDMKSAGELPDGGEEKLPGET